MRNEPAFCWGDGIFGDCSIKGGMEETGVSRTAGLSKTSSVPECDAVHVSPEIRYSQFKSRDDHRNCIHEVVLKISNIRSAAVLHIDILHLAGQQKSTLGVSGAVPG